MIDANTPTTEAAAAAAAVAPAGGCLLSGGTPNMLIAALITQRFCPSTFILVAYFLFFCVLDRFIIYDKYVCIICGDIRQR